MKLKIDFHTHSKEDPRDRYIKHSTEDLVEKAISESFNSLAITHHNSVFFNEELDNHARNNGLILIPGSEVSVKGDKKDDSKGRHVLIYCSKNMKDIKKMSDFVKKEYKTLNEIRDLKNEEVIKLIIAPHPFYYTKDCLNSYLVKNIDLFDAIEENWFYTDKIFPNRNKPAEKVAQEYNKPMISASSTHNLKRFGRNYTVIDVGNKDPDSILFDKTLDSVFEPIKNNEQDKIENVSQSLSLPKYLKGCINHCIRDIVYY